MFEEYKIARNDFNKKFSDYNNAKNKYFERKNFLSNILTLLYKKFNKRNYISDVVLLKNINIAYEEYYNKIYEELSIDFYYKELKESSNNFINNINNIENLYKSSKINFINNNKNSHIVFLTLKESLSNPIIKNNDIYIFNEDLSDNNE